MDQLTALRALGDAQPGPSDAALARGRALLEARLLAEAAERPPGRTRRRRPGRPTTLRHPARRAFIALGGLAAAAVVVTLVFTDALGIGDWRQNGISTSPTDTAGPQLVFTLPDSCASLVDPAIIAEWSARYGDAPLVGEMGAPLGSATQPAGRSCSYGATDTGFPSFSVAVDVFSAESTRSAREADLQGQGLEPSNRSDGTTVYSSDTPDASGGVAQAILVTDDAEIVVRAAGVSAADGPALVPVLTGWLARIAARLEVPADGSPNPASTAGTVLPPTGTPATVVPAAFTLPGSCAEVVGSDILPQWSPRFGDASPVGDTDTGTGTGAGAGTGARYSVPGTDETGLHCTYGSAATGRLLTIVVGTIDSAPGGRARAEAQQRQLDTAEMPLGDGTLFDEKLGRDPVSATLTLVTDSAIITVGAQGTEQGGAELLPYLRAFLDDISARTGADS